MHHLTNTAITLLAHYGLAGIFLSMVIENIGIPLPTEGAFLVGQNLISLHHYSFWQLYWFIVVAQVIGAVIAYAIGQMLTVQLERWFGHRAGFHRTKVKVVGWYQRYGSVTVLATRLIGYVRPWSSLVAGFADFDFWPFLFWTIIGTMLLVYPTMRVTGLLLLVWQRFPGLHLLISLGLFGTFFALFIYAGIQKIRRRKKAR